MDYPEWSGNITNQSDLDQKLGSKSKY